MTLLKLSRHDTGKVNLLINLSREYVMASKYDEAKIYAEEAISLAEKKNHKVGILNAHKALGSLYHSKAMYFQRQSNYPEAIKNYLAAVKIRERIDDKIGLGRSYGNMAWIYRGLSNFSEALKIDFTSLKYFEEARDSMGIAGAYNSVGIDYMNLTRYDEALKYYQFAIRIFEILGRKDWLVDRYFNLGFMYEDIGNYPEALKYHGIALKLAEELGDKGSIAPALHNFGSVYYLQAKKEPDTGKKKQLLNKALDYQFRSLKTYEEGGINYGLSTIHLFIGKIYFELRDYTEAKEHTGKALTFAKEDHAVFDVKESYLLLTSLDSATGNWGEALKNYRSYISFRDSLTNEENTRNLLQAEMQYVFDKKGDSLRYQQELTAGRLKQQTLLALQQRQQLLLQEQDLNLLNKEKKLQQLQIENDQAEFAVQKAEADKKQEQLVILNKEKEIQSMDLKKQRLTKNFFIAGLMLFAILSFFVYRNYHTRQRLKLQTLRNKIASDLHDDVGSTLSSISIFSQMAQQQSKEVVPLLETIGESSRKMLDAMADIVWTIKPENDQFEKIIMRMKSFAYELLGARHIDFEFDADDEVVTMRLPMEIRKNLYLIFKEATNNMVKYSEANRAIFAIKKDRNNLTMTIQDNGKGFDSAQAGQGNGLSNMRKRAEEIGGQFFIDSNPGAGTTIQLKIAI